jgi:hypothetical protein
MNRERLVAMIAELQAELAALDAPPPVVTAPAVVPPDGVNDLEGSARVCGVALPGGYTWTAWRLYTQAAFYAAVDHVPEAAAFIVAWNARSEQPDGAHRDPAEVIAARTVGWNATEIDLAGGQAKIDAYDAALTRVVPLLWALGKQLAPGEQWPGV